MEKVSELQMSQWTASQEPDFDWASYQQEQEEANAEALDEALATRDAAARVRDVNVRYTELLLAELSGEPLETFRAAIADERLSNPNPMNPFSGGSRVTIAFELIDDLGALDAMMGAQRRMFASFTGGEGAAQSATPPLTDEQRDQIDEVKREFEDRRRSILAQNASVQAEIDESTINVGFPGGTATIVRNDAGGGGMNPFMAMRRGGDDEAVQAFRRELAELDQWAIDRLREILTLDQRAVFAHF
jgi:hypothetical protein